MFKHILLPTDGSELSKKAIDAGVRLAQTVKAKVTGLCVMPEYHPFLFETPLSKKVMEQVAKRCKSLAENYLAVVGNAAEAAGVESDGIYEVNDHVYESIIRVADEKGCDLILMAAHGRRGMKTLLLGSETQKVLTHSKIPVLVVR